MEVARVNGQRGLGLVFREVMPNLLPFIMASFVGAVGAAMLAGVGAKQFYSLDMALANLCQPYHNIEPDKNDTARYDEHYKKYK